MKFVAFGDSVMWGQGLADKDKFCVKAAEAIAKMENRPFDRAKDLKILAHSGASIEASETSRKDFAHKFQHLFESPTHRAAFERDGTAWTGMHGELGQRFPTVKDQVRNFSQQEANEIDVVFLDGGANDVNFQNVINPETGSFQKDAALIYGTMHYSMKYLIMDVQRKFPQALIIYTGYYPIFSLNTSVDKVKDFFYWMEDKAEWQVDANENYQSNRQVIDFLTLGTSWLFMEGMGTKDVTYLARTSIRRIFHAYHFASYVMQNVIDSFKNPNLIYAAPKFHLNNSLWAPGIKPHSDYKDQQAIFNNYKSGTVTDAAYQDRVNAAKALVAPIKETHAAFAKKYEEMDWRKRAIHVRTDEINKALEGSLSEAKRKELEEEKRRIYNERWDIQNWLTENWRNWRISLGFPSNFEKEVKEVIPMISLMHPNERGAKLYTDAIVDKYKLWREPSVRKTIGANGGSVTAALSNLPELKSLKAGILVNKVGQFVLQLKGKRTDFYNFEYEFYNTVRINFKSAKQSRSYSLLPLESQSDGIATNSNSINENTLIDPFDSWAQRNQHWMNYIFITEQDETFGTDLLYVHDIESIELEGTYMNRPHLDPNNPPQPPVFRSVGVQIDNQVFMLSTQDTVWNMTQGTPNKLSLTLPT